MIVLGIDPGKSGAVARLDTSDQSLRVQQDFDTEHDLVKAIHLLGEGCNFAAIEAVHAMPMQGVVSCFTFGYWTGVAVGACKTHGMTILRPQPLMWQRDAGAGPETSLYVARELFPAYVETLFARKKDNGTSDAVLIARWAARKIAGTV